MRKLLDAIVDRGAPIQANRTFALIRKAFNFGLGIDMVETNPCQGVSRPAKERRRDRVLSADEIRGLWESFPSHRPLTVAVIKLLLLTAQRVGEVLTMRWSDIDLDAGWWTIPAERSKNQLPHRVPLNRLAREVLAEVNTDGSGSPWVFPSPRTDGPQVTIKKTIRLIRQGISAEFTPHDLRRTAASYMTRMGIPRFTVARILNHAESDVTAVYDRHSYDQEKRRALDAWGVRLEGIVAERSSKVVPLFRA